MSAPVKQGDDRNDLTTIPLDHAPYKYSRAPEMGSEGCGVLDTPLSRSMTANDNEAQRFTAVAAQASAATTQLRPLCLARTALSCSHQRRLGRPYQRERHLDNS